MHPKRILSGLALGFLAVILLHVPTTQAGGGHGHLERQFAAQFDYRQAVLDKGGKKLTEVQLRDMFGKPVKMDFKAFVDERIWGTNTWNPDGTASNVWHNPKGTGADFGNWTLEGDTLCYKWKRFGGTAWCGNVYQISATEYAIIKPDNQDANWWTVSS
jgi:hypothetical protein